MSSLKNKKLLAYNQAYYLLGWVLTEQARNTSCNILDTRRQLLRKSILPLFRYPTLPLLPILAIWACRAERPTIEALRTLKIYNHEITAVTEDVAWLRVTLKNAKSVHCLECFAGRIDGV